MHPHATDPPRSARPTDKRELLQFSGAALTARRSGCFSLRITDNLQDTARFVRAAFTRKESGSDGDHVDRCLHCYVNAITAVRCLYERLGALGMLVRIVEHAATACASNRLRTTQE